MYSEEIISLLKLKKNIITSEEYLEIFNIENSPQIQSIKYDNNSNNYIVSTYDNYNFKFKVIKLSK